MKVKEFLNLKNIAQMVERGYQSQVHSLSLTMTKRTERHLYLTLEVQAAIKPHNHWYMEKT